MLDPNPGAAKPITRRLPRFRLFHMLVLFVVVAVGIVAVRDWLAVRRAREEFDAIDQLWANSRVSVTQVMDASDALRDAELRSFWISSDQALQGHCTRLKTMKQKNQVMFQESAMGRDGWKNFNAQMKTLEALLEDCND